MVASEHQVSVKVKFAAISVSKDRKYFAVADGLGYLSIVGK